MWSILQKYYWVVPIAWYRVSSFYLFTKINKNELLSGATFWCTGGRTAENLTGEEINLIWKNELK